MSPTMTILLVGTVVASSCALIGSFMILRRLALLGDAISHAVLPGIVIAFLLTGDRAPIPMILGAGALGLLTVFLVEMFQRTRRLKEDASIGVVFPALFSIGVILITRYANNVHLDLDCVLYGEIAYAPLDRLIVGGTDWGSKALWVNGVVMVINLLFVLLFYKELKITTFDPQLAATLGLSPLLMHYLLMGSVSVTVVGAFESVGAILVLALLVVPPSAAYLWTDRLGAMLSLSVLFGAASAWIGYYLARWWDTSIAGCIALATGLILLASLMFSTKHGLVRRWSRRREMGFAMSEQLVLLHLEPGGRPLALGSLTQRFSWPASRFARIASRLREKGWVDLNEDEIRLTALGEREMKRTGRDVLRHRQSD